MTKDEEAATLKRMGLAVRNAIAVRPKDQAAYLRAKALMLLCEADGLYGRPVDDYFALLGWDAGEAEPLARPMMAEAYARGVNQRMKYEERASR